MLAPPWSLLPVPRALERSAGSAGERSSYVGDTLLTSFNMPPASAATGSLYTPHPVVRLHACGWWKPRPVRQRAADVQVGALCAEGALLDASVQCIVLAAV